MGRIKRIILFLLAFFFLTALSRNIFEYQKNYSFYNQYKQDYEKEKKRNIELKTMLVKTEDSFEFEKSVRNKLNLHKENETILVIPEPTPTIFTPTPTAVPNYQMWLDVFLKD